MLILTLYARPRRRFHNIATTLEFRLLQWHQRMIYCAYHSFYSTPLGVAEVSDELDPAQGQGLKCTREGGQV
jgi:hypothetical protein